MIKKIIIILILSGVILPSFSFAQVQQPPENLEEAGKMGERALRGLPQALKEPWQEALRVWGRMWNWAKGIWNSYISPWLKNIWYKITVPFKKEIKRRQPIIEEEFKKEKIEMKEEIKVEIPKTGKSLWQRFKELIR